MVTLNPSGQLLAAIIKFCPKFFGKGAVSGNTMGTAHKVASLQSIMMSTGWNMSIS